MKDKQGWTRTPPEQAGTYWYKNVDGDVRRITLHRSDEGELYHCPWCKPLRIWPGKWQRAEVPTPPGQADREEGCNG